MSLKYKAAIFDMDGTILNTLEDLADSVNHTLKSNGLPERTIEEVRSFVGNGIRKLIERAVPANTNIEIIEKVFDDFKKYYKDHCAIKTRPYEGIVELLDSLKKLGVKVAVNSNKADFAVQELCNQYFPGIFDYALGEKEGINKKPAPDGVNLILNALAIEKSGAVFIGDSDVDIETAINSKVDGIAVTWGFRDKDFLKENGASVFADTPQHILKLMEN